ncbi:MAG: hypothetical protein ACK55Z_27890 [bacterium]
MIVVCRLAVRQARVRSSSNPGSTPHGGPLLSGKQSGIRVDLSACIINFG